MPLVAAAQRLVALITPPMARRLGVQHFRDPTVDNALAVGAGVIGIDRKNLRTLQYHREAGLERDIRVRGDEVDLVLREESLHRRRSGPVDQLLAERGILGTLEQRNPFGRRADAFLREAYRHLVAFRLGIERVDDKENAGAGLTQADRQRAPAAAFGIQ